MADTRKPTERMSFEQLVKHYGLKARVYGARAHATGHQAEVNAAKGHWRRRERNGVVPWERPQ